ncbi:sulfatase [Halorubrum sp. SD683]|uniref:sulfatase n=1 Tax=Halorubrum sp. SD683 TaxID=1855873 RepID=UPI000A359D1C|nr:sulfatase [Halorubrum sp. SD683]
MQPNILFLVTDALRIDHCSTYGYERETTPAMTRLAEEGVRYNNAFAPSIWTPTVHGAIFTGKYPSHTGIYANSLRIPDELETLSEALKGQGYRTFAASAGAHIRKSRGYARGVDEYVETRRINPDLGFAQKVLSDRSFAKQVGLSLTRGPDDKTWYKYDRLKRFIDDAADDGEPFFGFINAKTAHQPFNPPRPYKQMFTEGLERPRWEFLERTIEALGGKAQDHPGYDIEKLRGVSHSGGDGVFVGDVEMTDEEWAVIKAWYDGAVRYVDDRISDLMDFLESRGVYEDTMVVVTADHGDNFGDHGGLTSHIFSLYDSLLHVPLVIKPPRSDNGSEVQPAETAPNGQEINNQVSLVDLYPTFLETAGGPVPNYRLTESLLGFEDRSYHDYTFAEYAGFDGPIKRLRRKYPDFDAEQFARPLQSVRSDEHKLIVTGSPEEECERELYAWRDDPDEERDLLGEQPEVADELLAVLRETLDPLDNPGEFEVPEDGGLEEQLKDLGYL